jgi:hypothetical protein
LECNTSAALKQAVSLTAKNEFLVSSKNKELVTLQKNIKNAGEGASGPAKNII